MVFEINKHRSSVNIYGWVLTVIPKPSTDWTSYLQFILGSIYNVFMLIMFK